METADLNTRLEIEKVVCAFEKAWSQKASQSTQPRIEDCLAQNPLLPQRLLFQICLEAELSLKQESYRPIDPVVYFQRFPDFSEELLSVFLDLNIELDPAFLNQFDVATQRAPIADSELARDTKTPATDRTRAWLNRNAWAGRPERATPADSAQSHLNPTTDFPLEHQANLPTKEPNGADFDTAPDADELLAVPGDMRSLRIGKYQLLNRLGAGGMGVVFCARDIELNREVALKLIRHAVANKQTIQDRFHLEAVAMARLHHANVVPVLDYGFADGFFYLAMLLIRGGTLEKPLGNLAFDRNVFLETFCKGVDGVQHAHEGGVIHRDLKPSNILLESNGNPRVGDFGLAKLVDSHDLTQSSQIMGSCNFMSPEQLASTKHVGVGADIYSLGVILYQHLTGGVPFTAANTAELIRKIQFQPPPSIRERAPDVSRDLETITMKCLAKRPEERYLKASDLADELRRYLRGEPILTRPIRWPVRMIRLARQRPMQTMLLAVSLMLFLAAAAAAVMFQQNAIQKSDLARVAEEKRDQAVAAQEKEQQLRLAAEAAKVDAEDAARFAEAHQLKAEFTTLEVYRENGTLSKNLEEISRIAALPGGSAVDTQWYLRQAQREVPVLARFNTADWGLYDVAVDAQRKRMVTCDRTGQISTWDLEKYQLVQMLTEVPVCPKTRIAFPRIRYHQLPQRPDITFGFVPDKLPDWYSSVAFSKEGAVLATTLDGRLIKFNGSESDQQKEIYRAESPLLLVRTNVAANQIALADKSGQIQLLDADGKPRCRFQLHAEPSLLAYRSSSGWVVGTVDGQVVLLDENLSELASLDLKQRIHDACTYSHFGQELILVAAGESAVQSWRLQAKQEKNSVENDDKQNVSNSEGLNRKQNEESEKESRDEKDKKLSDPQQFDLIEVQLYQQLKREEHHEFHRLLPDESSGQLIVLDNAGCPWVWDLESGKFLHTIFLTPRTDIRALPSDKAALVLDQLEARSPWFLHRGHQGILRFDCIGGVIEVSVDHIKKTQELWKPLAVNVGVQPRMVADPNSTTRVWSLSCIGDLMLFDTLADQVLGRVEKAHAGGYCDLSVFPNGDAITAGNDSWLRVWRYVDGKVREIRKLEGPGHLLSVAISPNERLAASVNSHGKLLVFEIQSGRLIQQLAFVDPSSEDVSSDSNAKNNLPSVTVNRVATGRLAFSKSGKFLAAFGTNQKFEVFDTETWNRVDLTHINIAGAGGVDVVFSPVEERRMVTASHDTSVNIVASQTPKIDQRMPVGAHPKSARQLVTTVLGDRILALNETGFIQSLSGLHFVHLASIPIPTREPWSLALTGADSGLVVGDAQGKVYYCQTQQQVPVEDSGRAVEGIVHELLRPGEETFFTTGDWLGLSPKRDANGHLCDVFVRGGLTDKSQELKLCLLQKREGVWRLERPRFQGDETGPCEHASLFIRPDNSRMVLIRQGLKGEYNGRLIAVYDDGSDNWPTEVILDRGNMGFSAYPRFGDDSRLQSVLHFDYSLQGLMHSSRKSEPGNWELQTVHAWAGQGLNGVQDSKGVHHLLMRRMRGWDGGLVMAMRLSPQGEMISFNGRGRWIYWAPRDRVLSFEPAEGILWELQNDQSWSPLARLPQLSGGCRPCISPDGWLWLAEPAGTSLSVYALQLSKVPTGTHIDLNDTQAGMEHWKRGKITFTGQVPSEPAVGTACHINDLGCLEVIVARLGGRSSLAVVEAVSPLRLDPEQQP